MSIKRSLLSLFVISSLLNTAGCGGPPEIDGVEPDDTDYQTNAAATLTNGGVYTIKSGVPYFPVGAPPFAVEDRIESNRSLSLLVAPSAGETSRAIAQFRAIKNTDDNTYSFQDLPSQRCLTVQNAGTANGTRVIAANCASPRQSHQRFFVTTSTAGSGDTRITLKPKHAQSMRVEYTGSSGAKLEINAYNQARATSSQSFYLLAPPSNSCKWNVPAKNKDGATVNRPMTKDQACANLLLLTPDTNDQSNRNLFGGWNPWAAYFVGWSVAAVITGALTYVITQLAGPNLAETVASCTFGGIGAGLSERLKATSGSWSQVARGTVVCIMGVMGRGWVKLNSGKLTSEIKSIQTDINKLLGHFYGGTQTAEAGVELNMTDLSAAITQEIEVR